MSSSVISSSSRRSSTTSKSVSSHRSRRSRSRSGNMTDLIHEMQELDMHVASHQLLSDAAVMNIKWKEITSNRIRVQSEHDMTRKTDKREKEIARTVCMLVQKDNHQVISSATDENDCHSVYTTDLILDELSCYEDDATSVISWRSQSSRKKKSRSRSRSSSKSVRKLHPDDYQSSPSSHNNHSVKLVAMEEADRLYNEFMKNVSPRSDVISHVTNRCSVTVPVNQGDLSLTKHTSKSNHNDVHEKPQSNKIVSQTLLKSTMIRSSSAPATTKAVDAINGFEDPFGFDPFGLKEETTKKSNIDGSKSPPFPTSNISETLRDWNRKVEDQPIRRYEFTFSESRSSKTSFPTSSHRNIQHLHPRTRHPNRTRQRALTEETHPDSYDSSLDSTNNSDHRRSEFHSLFQSKKTLDDNPWEGFQLSANFSSITSNWESIKYDFEGSPTGISDFPHPPSLRRGRST